ncbi:hypothetical protein B0J11DRAFT_308344 [Dendryphion nanum]|uniref:RING-type domain-containing protein n=1 Tax=Dendryphion nanum TaxID=256645 RepID=A0A9P9IM75_9PLEO|nr:hypothetical protein B0J11DRAFT_308344 [Dendryphion nanum]
MGTLTGDCPVLDAHCPHKLATSCRLTSTLNCCACADERSHTLTYRVYIDGVGFVNRGTRWQGYCWFCKEFWNNRLAATYPPLQLSQTRVPFIPDQTEFLDKWFEFHRGYRIASLADGTDQRIAVIGEPWKDVSPGFLPRTLDEMRNQRNDASRAANRFLRRRLSSEDVEPDETPQQSLEDALNDLLQEDSEDEEESPQSQESEAGPPNQGSTSVQLDLPPLTTSVPTREERARERFTRLFGTRQDVEQDDYISPLTTMYQRAWTRHQEAERLRDSGQQDAPPLNSLVPEERRRVEQQILWSVMRDSRGELLNQEEQPTSATAANPPSTSTIHTPSTSSAELRRAIERVNSNLLLISNATSTVASAISAMRTMEPQRSLDMDKQDRPPPMEDEEMTKKLACSICYSQLADTALLPCGHMIMCQWCADLHIPVKHSHIPIRPSNCPKCRKQVKQRFRIHM